MAKIIKFPEKERWGASIVDKYEDKQKELKACFDSYLPLLKGSSKEPLDFKEAIKRLGIEE